MMSESDYPAGASYDDAAPFNEGLKRRSKRPRIRSKSFTSNYKFKCSRCGTNFSSSSNTPPPSPKWDDGHICLPILIKDDTK